MEFTVSFAGHPNIRSNHARTVEITRETDLTPQGDCIVGVGADCACAGLPGALKARLREPGAGVLVTFRAGGGEFAVRGRGDPALELSHAGDIVLRRSGFVCPRTLAVRCDAASDMMPRGMVGALRDPAARGTMTIRVD